jgi:hypothetical protein
MCFNFIDKIDFRIDKTYLDKLIRGRSRPPASVAATWLISIGSVEDQQGKKLDNEVFSIIAICIFDVYFVRDEFAYLVYIVIISWVI